MTMTPDPTPPPLPTAPLTPPPLPPRPPDRTRPRGVADVVATVTELVAYAAALVICSLFGTLLLMASGGCNETGDCRRGLIATGVGLVVLGTWLPFVAAAIWALVRGVGGRATWWIPWVGFAGSAAVFVAGLAAVAMGAHPGR